jgi:hypothetical protein
MAEKFNVIVEAGEDGYLISDVIELPRLPYAGEDL